MRRLYYKLWQGDPVTGASVGVAYSSAWEEGDEFAQRASAHQMVGFVEWSLWPMVVDWAEGVRKESGE